MPTAEIIAIGTELLLGETQDTNTKFLARGLRSAGIDLYRTTIIGDNAIRIANAIREAFERAQIVITTGGLGPTVDDPTRQAVSLAFGVEPEYRPELWEQITNRFSKYNRQATENNRRQAFIPAGATAIENPVGTAPSFYMQQEDRFVISLPGVPREMEFLFENAVLPMLIGHYHLLGTIRTRVLHLAGIGESQVDELIGDLETYENPTVGLSAHDGQIDVRITAKADSPQQVETMLADMAEILANRLDDHVYGIDETTLEDVVVAKLAQKGWTLALFECGLNGELINRFNGHRQQIIDAMNLEKPCSPDLMLQKHEEFIHSTKADCTLTANLTPGFDSQQLNLIVTTPVGAFSTDRFFGGHPSLRNAWSVTTTLDFLRRTI